jgi:rRNA-processing protein FCF1
VKTKNYILIEENLFIKVLKAKVEMAQDIVRAAFFSAYKACIPKVEKIGLEAIEQVLIDTAIYSLKRFSDKNIKDPLPDD